MKFKTEASSDCPLCIPVQILSGKWKINVVGLMMMNNEPWRFTDLKNRLSITSKVLSAVLKELEEDGIIARSVIDDTPVKVEYSLTEEGIPRYSRINPLEGIQDVVPALGTQPVGRHVLPCADAKFDVP